jgi:hypothetical protein
VEVNVRNQASRITLPIERTETANSAVPAAHRPQRYASDFVAWVSCTKVLLVREVICEILVDY